MFSVRTRAPGCGLDYWLLSSIALQAPGFQLGSQASVAGRATVSVLKCKLLGSNWEAKLPGAGRATVGLT